jgi:hypothetical protein
MEQPLFVGQLVVHVASLMAGARLRAATLN